LFGIALGTYLGLICEVFNKQAIPRLIGLNGEAFKGITAYPELIHSDIESHDLEKLGAFLRNMIGVGAIVPDENLEDYLRMVADLPEREDETAYMGGNQRGRKAGAGEPSPAVGDAENGEPEDGEV
jgi:hypothetical protein